jgi:hypothetical protein
MVEIVFTVMLLLLGGAVGYGAYQRRSNLTLSSALNDVMDRSIGQSMRYEEQVASLKAQVSNEIRKREELFKSVDDAVNETRRWRDLYFVEAMEHGNAQVAMMNEIARLSKLLSAKGVNVKLNRGIEAALNEFREHHPVTQEQYAEAKKSIK